MTAISLTVSRGENFTPASLMKRYADRTPGVIFHYSYWGSALLAVNQRNYEYPHWGITAENGVEIVTVYLREV